MQHIPVLERKKKKRKKIHNQHDDVDHSEKEENKKKEKIAAKDKEKTKEKYKDTHHKNVKTLDPFLSEWSRAGKALSGFWEGSYLINQNPLTIYSCIIFK